MFILTGDYLWASNGIKGTNIIITPNTYHEWGDDSYSAILNQPPLM